MMWKVYKISLRTACSKMVLVDLGFVVGKFTIILENSVFLTI